MTKSHLKIGLLLVVVGVVGFIIATTMTTKADVTPRLDPESGRATCPAGFALEDFESGTDGYRQGGGPIESTIEGVEFVATDGNDWLTGDWAAGYNGKYPSGAYTSGGQKWAWLGTNQSSGIIDFTEGRKASYVSVYTSTYSGLVLEAYADDGTLLETSGWADRNTRTGTMTQLSILRPTADIGYVIAHDTGNFWLIDWLCVALEDPKKDETPKVQEVGIDINPGTSRNVIVRKSKGTVLVALLGSENFDVTTVDSDTVVFDDASPSKTGKAPKDVNKDGYPDLMFHFNVNALGLVSSEPVTLPSDTEACLSGSTTNGIRFEGCDSVRIVR